MKDSRMKSLAEACFNVFVGFTINFVANILILPLIGTPFNLVNFGLIGVAYTFISLTRSYVIRRWFVNGLYESFCRFIGKVKGLLK